jgi:phosphatidylethanolamine-binding protein
MATFPAAVQRGFISNALQDTTDKRRPWTDLRSDLVDDKGTCFFVGTWKADIYSPRNPKLPRHHAECKAL